MAPTGEFIALEPYFDGTLTPPGVVGWIKVDSTTTRGNVKASTPTIVIAGRNLGRKNATNILQQALRDALGLHTKQLKKAAAVPLVGKKLFFPMLAQVLSEQKKSIWELPARKFLSPKLDGLRAVFTWDGDVLRSYSRTITPFPGPDAIHAELREPLRARPDLFLDGEFYTPGVNLQDINSAVRGNTGADVEYHIYDCFTAAGTITPEPFHQRHARLQEFFAQNPQFVHIKLVPQHEVANEAAAVALYKEYLEQGYEGAMIRLDAPYESKPNNYHSKMLLKMKPRLDAEFELVGWETAQKGKAAGALMLVCKTTRGHEFRVTPAMTFEERVALAARMPAEFDAKWRGRMITVNFATWSTDRIPQQPTTLMHTRVD
jgi:ATP-dependent DNA ligase